MIRFDSAGRVQPVEYKYMAAPATCLLCSRIGRDSEELFANLGVELEYFGVAYLCQDCCSEIANFICYVPYDQHKTVGEDNIKLLKEAESLREKLYYVKGLLDARINSVGSNVPVGDGSSDPTLFEVESESDDTNPEPVDNEPVVAESGKK